MINNHHIKHSNKSIFFLFNIILVHISLILCIIPTLKYYTMSFVNAYSRLFD